MTDEEKFVLHDPELFVGDNALARRGEPLHVWEENTSATCLTEATEMTNEELVKRLRPLSWSDIDARFGVPMDETMREAADRIETLTEQLEAARADAKEAEAYAEELEKERDTAREYAGEVRKREMAAEDARVTATDKLEKAVEALREIAGECGCSTARALLAEIEGEKG